MHDHLVADVGEWITCEMGHHSGTVMAKMTVENEGLGWSEDVRGFVGGIFSWPTRRIIGACVECGGAVFNRGLFFHSIHVKDKGWMPLRAAGASDALK